MHSHIAEDIEVDDDFNNALPLCSTLSQPSRNDSS
jgi:hypothetical protein